MYAWQLTHVSFLSLGRGFSKKPLKIFSRSTPFCLTWVLDEHAHTHKHTIVFFSPTLAFSHSLSWLHTHFYTHEISSSLVHPLTTVDLSLSPSSFFFHYLQGTTSLLDCSFNFSLYFYEFYLFPSPLDAWQLTHAAFLALG